MRALSVVGADDGVQRVFEDVELLARSCEYPNCSHAGEQGCALIAALFDGRLERGRLESWLRLKAEPASSELQMTHRDIADRKQRKAGKVAQRRAARK
jgi:ribosome biogenesis GTPase